MRDLHIRSDTKEQEIKELKKKGKRKKKDHTLKNTFSKLIIKN